MKYQYATIDSNLAANKNQEYVLENDSIQIRYSFSGYGGPVQIAIQNKLNTPIYVDWKRSALVMNDKSNTYWQNESSLLATADGYEIEMTPTISSSSSDIKGVIRGEESTAFIAPNSYHETKMNMIDAEFIQPADSMKAKPFKMNTPKGPVSASRYSYNSKNSPLKFRSYLTISHEPTFANAKMYQSDFWVSEVLNTSSGPNSFTVGNESKNLYYKSKGTGFGVVVGTAGLLIVLGALAAMGN